MQVNVAGLRRNIKNLAHNYSDAQVKVREATSNDPWGPSSTLMAEIADLTYNVVAFTEIMQMIWKRLNDHGRNWRHVYKALVLLEYLIKTGTEKVSQQCRENIFAIQTLKDFQYLEEGKDQGVNVREKAKQLFSLLKDDERLRNERARALKAKERFAQTASGFGSDGQLDTPTSPKYPTWEGRSGETLSGAAAGELETARPQTAGEEELQLQLALAMSREEAEQDAARRRSDQLRLQLALSQSQTDFQVSPPSGQQPQQSHVLDLLDVNLGESEPAVDAWGASAPPITPPRPQLNKTTTQADPWSVSSSVSPPLDPWAPINNAGIPAASAKPDPWAPVSALSTSPNLQPDIMASPLSDLDEFDIITNRNTPQITNGNTNNNNKLIESNTSPDPFDFGVLNDTLPSTMTASSGAIKKTPQSFLGENSALVNLDNLVTKTTTSSTSPAFNPFAETIQPKPTINQIKQPFTNTATQQPALDPWAPVPTSTNTSSTSPWPNPFLS